MPRCLPPSLFRRNRTVKLKKIIQKFQKKVKNKKGIPSGYASDTWFVAESEVAAAAGVREAAAVVAVAAARRASSAGITVNMRDTAGLSGEAVG